MFGYSKPNHKTLSFCSVIVTLIIIRQFIFLYKSCFYKLCLSTYPNKARLNLFSDAPSHAWKHDHVHVLRLFSLLFICSKHQSCTFPWLYLNCFFNVLHNSSKLSDYVRFKNRFYSDYITLSLCVCIYIYIYIYIWQVCKLYVHNRGVSKHW